MGESKRRTLNKPDISVLIPVRGRPQETARCVESLLRTAGDDRRYEILLAFDDDEGSVMEDFVGHLTKLPDPTILVSCCWIRPPTLGDKLNRLAGEAKGDIMFFLANDYEMVTDGWPDLFREAVAALPNGIGVPYPRDDEHPDHASFPIITRKQALALNFFMPPWFPYWFIDTWWDELGILTGLKREIGVEVKLQGERGKSHALVDLEFWATFFEETRPMRSKDACFLMAQAYGEASAEFRATVAKLSSNCHLCAQRIAHLRHPDFVKAWEAKAASAPSEAYPGVKANAEALMAKMRQNRPRRIRVAVCTPSGRGWEAGTATDIAGLMAFSAQAGIEMAILNIQTSMISQARNATAEAALNEKMDYLFWIDSDMRFPPDALMRLLAHEKDIVGATYNKRFPPYETLGKLKGKQPETIEPGLHEAFFLPGGMLLVKADVYRKAVFPQFFECYQWPGVDGLEAFKNMMRDYFRDVPSDELLATLDGTEFGEWVRENYILGEFGDRLAYVSEDINFCRKARKAGYQIWLDIDLTYEVKHIGTFEIPCKNPATLTEDERKQLSMAGFAAAK